MSSRRVVLLTDVANFDRPALRGSPAQACRESSSMRMAQKSSPHMVQ
jgi:hypothetical protein